MQAKRIKWKEPNLKAQNNNLVFLDESSVSFDMIRRYGRIVGKTQVHCSALLNTPPTQTILAPVRLNGQTTYTIYSGGTTGCVSSTT